MSIFSIIGNFIADVIADNMVNDVKIRRKRHKRKKWTKIGKNACVFYIQIHVYEDMRQPKQY